MNRVWSPIATSYRYGATCGEDERPLPGALYPPPGSRAVDWAADFHEFAVEWGDAKITKKQLKVSSVPLAVLRSVLVGRVAGNVFNSNVCVIVEEHLHSLGVARWLCYLVLDPLACLLQGREGAEGVSRRGEGGAGGPHASP